jgi:hypothetical protein
MAVFRQAGTNLKFPVQTDSTVAADPKRKHLIIQNRSGADAFVIFDTTGTPTANSCHLKLADGQIEQIPNFTGSVITSDNDVMCLEFY